MKVTSKETIEMGEKELLDTIIAELDWDIIEEKLKEKHGIRLQEGVEFNNGDLVVYGNKIAYKLQFDVKITLSVLFDRLGECLIVSASGENEISEENLENMDKKSDNKTLPDSSSEDYEKNGLVSDLADMIQEINEDE